MLPNVNSPEDLNTLLLLLQDDFIDMSYSVEQAIEASASMLDHQSMLTLKLIYQHLDGFEKQLNNLIYR